MPYSASINQEKYGLASEFQNCMLMSAQIDAFAEMRADAVHDGRTIELAYTRLHLSDGTSRSDP